MHRKQQQKQKKNYLRTFLFLFFLVSISVISYIGFKVITLDKFIYINNNFGDAEIIIVNKYQFKPLKILLKKDVLLKTSRNLGDYKVQNIWVLGDKEGYQGKLIADTVSSNFFLPISLWKDVKKSNLNFWQKLKLKFLDYGENYDYFLVLDKVDSKIKAEFVDAEISSRMPKVRIENLSGDVNRGEMISNILETLGFKTVDYQRGYDENIDCLIYAKNSQYSYIASKIFSCKEIIDSNLNYDLIIRVGRIFSDRY